MSEPLASADAHQPARRILHVIFVVDCSGSMTGERIGSLNWAARAAVPAMREAAADHPDTDVMIRVVRFADGVDWPVRVPTPAAEFVWTTLAAGGESSMGAALAAVAAALAEPGRDDGAELLPPVIVLLSDGLPTDDVRSGIAALAATELGARAVRVPIAIGQDADHDLLQAFIGDPALRPLRANNAEMLVSRVRWAASAPLKAIAGPAGAGPLAALAGQAEHHDEGDGSLVW